MHVSLFSLYCVFRALLIKLAWTKEPNVNCLATVCNDMFLYHEIYNKKTKEINQSKCSEHTASIIIWTSGSKTPWPIIWRPFLSSSIDRFPSLFVSIMWNICLIPAISSIGNWSATTYKLSLLTTQLISNTKKKISMPLFDLNLLLMLSS